MTEISRLVDQAIAHGALTQKTEDTISQLSSCQLPDEDMFALDKLMQAMLSGAVTKIPEKAIENLWEAPVLEAAIARTESVDMAICVAKVAMSFLAPQYARLPHAETWAAPLIQGAVEAAARRVSQVALQGSAGEVGQ